jgi:hypothetical protein
VITRSTNQFKFTVQDEVNSVDSKIKVDFALTGIYRRTKTQFVAFMFTESEQSLHKNSPSGRI